MFTQMASRFAAFGRRRKGSSGTPIRPRLLPFFLALLTHGCSTAPPASVAGADPADPRAPTPPVGYRSNVGPYQSQRPVEPAPWGEQNQRVAPQPKSGP